MEVVEPVTERAKRLREQVKDQRWARIVEDAQGRAAVVKAVEEVLAKGELSLRQAQAQATPGVPWPTYVKWRRRYRNRRGPAWERLVDERLPPPPREIPEVVRKGACLLREQDRSINAERTRELLVKQFGEDGDVSDASLRRIWAAAGLKYVPRAGEAAGVPGEEVTHFSGGGGLALLAAADAELGASGKLAAAAQAAGRQHAASQGEVEVGEPWEGERDELGQFTSVYNRRWREQAEVGQADGRWDSDEDKRRRRQLDSLATLKMEPATLAGKLLCMGITPLLTERRGFAGLEGPAGGWLGVLGTVAYMPSTLSKGLAELGLLGVDEALWNAHAKMWHGVSRRWSESGPSWLQLAAYIDATQDPYWTRRFAKSGKVSRVGRVMPCLSRVAVTSGPGVPVLMETYAGAAPLKRHLLRLLSRLDETVGDGEVGRLTVVDGEAGTAGMLWALHDQADRIFVTVLKGQVLKGAEVDVVGDWVPYRQRDQLREVLVGLEGEGAPKGGIAMRGVEMQRADSRHATSTLFVTNAGLKLLWTPDVATVYLSRWPHQEQRFRDARNGGGGNRSHGYCGGYVAHVALETKLEKASGTLQRAEVAHEQAQQHQAALAATEEQPTEPVDKQSVKLADQEVRRTRKAADKARAKLERLSTMPRTIYARDTGRDSTMTCFKALVMMLMEYVLQEYFGGKGMEWRTFIELFVPLPVTVRTSKSRRLYQLHPNLRQPKRTEQLRAACVELNRRGIRRGGTRLVFEVLEPPEPGS